MISNFLRSSRVAAEERGDGNRNALRTNQSVIRLMWLPLIMLPVYGPNLFLSRIERDSCLWIAGQIPIAISRFRRFCDRASLARSHRA